MKIFRFFNSKIKLLDTFLIIILLFLFVHLINLLRSSYISVEFKDFRHVASKINVYYKGLKVGEVYKAEVNHENQSARVVLRLTYKGLKLPVNTTAVLKREKKKHHEYDYIELVYPKYPSQYLITKGSVLDGLVTTDLENYFANNSAEDFEKIKQNLITSTESLEIALSALADLLQTLDGVVKENQVNLYNSSANLSKMTSNLDDITGKINNAIRQDSLNQNFRNIDDSLANLKTTTEHVQNITNNFEYTTQSLNTAMPQVDSVIYQTQGLISNLNEITGGVKTTMKKPFGGLRLLFGRTINDKSNSCGK